MNENVNRIQNFSLYLSTLLAQTFAKLDDGRNPNQTAIAPATTTLDLTPSPVDNDFDLSPNKTSTLPPSTYRSTNTTIITDTTSILTTQEKSEIVPSSHTNSNDDVLSELHDFYNFALIMCTILGILIVGACIICIVVGFKVHKATRLIGEFMVRNEDQSLPVANKLLSLTFDESADHKTDYNNQSAAQSGAQNNGDGHIEYTTGISPTPIQDVHDKNAKNLNATLMLHELTSDHGDFARRINTPQKIDGERDEGNQGSHNQDGDAIVYALGETGTNNDLSVADVDVNVRKLQGSDEEDSQMSAMYDQIDTKQD